MTTAVFLNFTQDPRTAGVYRHKQL